MLIHDRELTWTRTAKNPGDRFVDLINIVLPGGNFHTYPRPPYKKPSGFLRRFAPIFQHGGSHSNLVLT